MAQVTGHVDTVIIGNGPSALILSYILHGHIPYYVGKHEDGIIDQKLRASPNLLDATPDVYSHFRSSLKYSTPALPVNTLLDTLIRPRGDTDITGTSCVEWRYEPEKAVPHIVVGDAPSAGGQWASNPVKTSPDIGTLSYGEQLSLPGYTLAEHWKAEKGVPLPELIHPTRRDLASYFAAYPKAAGIADVVRTSTRASHVVRTPTGFIVGSPNIHCKHLVLASGSFNINLPPPHFLHPLIPLDAEQGDILVIGSGFTAADIISSTPPHRKIIHLYNWDPEHRPSPLAACNKQAYPAYWWIYQQMRLEATRHEGKFMRIPSKPKDKNLLPTFTQRDWNKGYEGFPNARIMSVFTSDAVPEEPGTADGASKQPNDVSHRFENAAGAPVHHGILGFLSRRRSSVQPVPTAAAAASTDSTAQEASKPTTIFIGRSAIGDRVTRHITSFRYAAGRRGSLSYLSPPLLQEVLSPPHVDPALHPLPAHLPLRGRISLDLGGGAGGGGSGRSSRRGSSTGAAAAASAAEDALAAAVQRRGSEEHDFAQELLISHAGGTVSGHTLRAKIEDAAAEQEEEAALAAATAASLADAAQTPAAADKEKSSPRRRATAGLEVAPSVFVVGSLTGDSLIRFAFGGCAVVAGAIMAERERAAAAAPAGCAVDGSKGS